MGAALLPLAMGLWGSVAHRCGNGTLACCAPCYQLWGGKVKNHTGLFMVLDFECCAVRCLTSTVVVKALQC